MLYVALAMLTRERGRYFGLVIALAFTAFVVTQQPSTLLGIMARTTALLRDTRGVDLWVMDAKVRYTEDNKPLADGALYRVRSVPGVETAMPFFKGSARARLADGTFQQCELYHAAEKCTIRVTDDVRRSARRDSWTYRMRLVASREADRPSRQVARPAFGRGYPGVDASSVRSRTRL